MATGWPLPDEVAQVAAGVVQSNRISNFGLLFQRYLKYPREWKIEGKDKSRIWKEDIVGRSKRIYQALGTLQDALQKRLEFLQTSLRAMAYSVETVPAEVVWRLSVGLGTASPLETGLTLHRIHGIPYLPGSAIKGVTRNWKLQQNADQLGIPQLNAQQIKEWKDEKHYGLTPWEYLEQLLLTPIPENPKPEDEKALQERWKDLQKTLQNERLALLQQWGFFDDAISKIHSLDLENVKQSYIREFSPAFGSTDTQGEVIFFDAYPTTLIVQEQSILELDIMNPHYSEYYTGDKPPADYLSPVPVYFLTVRAGTPFRFCLAAKDHGLLTDAKNWLIQALQDNGIGAKTRAGYGELGEASSNPSPHATPSAGSITTTQTTRISEEPKLTGEQLLDALSESQKKQPAEKTLRIGDKLDAKVIENTNTEVTVRLIGANNEEITFEQAYYPKAVGERVKLKIRQIDAQGRITRVGP